MTTTPNGWRVLDEATATLAYTYTFSRDATANAFATRMADGRMMVISPPCRASEGVMDDVAQFGDVGALVANNGFYYMGQPEWKAHFADATCYAAPEAVARIHKKSGRRDEYTPLSELQPLLGDGILVREVPNTRCGETWAHVTTASGRVWFGSDVLANMPELPKPLPFRMIFKWTKSAPGYSVFGLAVRIMIKDWRGALELMAQDVENAPPTIMVPGHGGILDDADLAEQTRALLRR